MVETDPNTVRYTPHAIAYHLMIQRNIYSQFTIEQDYLNPIDVDGGFGYAAPITPDGTLQHFTAHTPGVMTFDDRPTTPDDKRVTQSNPISEKEWAYGLQMYPFDNLELHLYRADPTTEYQIYYLDLSTTTTQNPGAPPAHEFVAVASRTKYRFQFPLVFIPYWDGVTLVHANGDIEQLSARQAEQDPRLKGKRLFPEELARTIVKAQSFDEGLWSGYINRPGKIKIPDMPVGNQMPFFTDGKDGHSYWVVATEPAGNSHSLFRIYYIDTNTGERTCFKYNTSDTIVGPEKALDLVEAAPALMNVSWNNHLAMEPVYLSRDGKVYWKVTVTVNNLSSITATAVVDAANNNVQVFQKRDDFEDWLRGKQPALATPSIESGPTASLTPAQIEQVREAAQKIISILGPPKK